MSRLSAFRPWLAASLGLSLLAGCQPPAAPSNPTPAVSASPDTTPVTPTSQTAVPVGLFGRAEIDGVPFTGAEVKIFRPGETTPVATGTTDASGKFIISTSQVISTGGGNFIGTNTGNVISTGGGNVISTGGGNVISTGGGNVISTGGGNVISTGGGNVISTGGGNLITPGAPLKVVASKEGQTLAAVGLAGVISTGGGNVISTGGGNVISTGGGNVISTGGGNYRTAQAGESEEVLLSLGSTVVVKLLGDRLDGVGRAITQSDGKVMGDLAERFRAAVQAMTQQVVTLLGQTANRKALIAQITAPNQAITLDVDPKIVKSIFTEAASTAEKLATIIRDGVSQGGKAPSDSEGRGLTFGTITVPPVTAPSTSNNTGSSGGGSNDDPPAAQTTPVSVDANFDVPGPAESLSVLDTSVLASNWTNPDNRDFTAPVTLAVNGYIDFMAPTGSVFDPEFYDQFTMRLVLDYPFLGDGVNNVEILGAEFLDANGQVLGTGPYMLASVTTGVTGSPRANTWDMLTGIDASLVRGIRISNRGQGDATLTIDSVAFDIVGN